MTKLEEFAEGFTDVDKTQDPSVFFALLDAQASLPAIINLREIALGMLDPRPGQTILEVGCGTGEAARAIASAGASVTGVDYSDMMLSEAKRRTADEDVTYVQGDAMDLQFPDASFDGVRSERTLQHLTDPRRALQEMIRVVKPGGRIVVVDTDWESSGVDLEDRLLSRKLSAVQADGFVSPDIGRRLYGLFKRSGLQDVSFQPVVLTLTQAVIPGVDVSPVKRVVDGALTAGTLTLAEAEAIIDDIDRADADGRLLLAVTMYAVCGTKPA